LVYLSPRPKLPNWSAAGTCLCHSKNME